MVFINALFGLWKGLPEGQVYTVGMALTGLVSASHRAPGLFDDTRRDSLIKTLDSLNTRYGAEAPHYGATYHTEGLIPLRISFTRIPDPEEL